MLKATTYFNKKHTAQDFSDSLYINSSLQLTNAQDDKEHNVDDEFPQRGLHMQLPVSFHIFRLTSSPQRWKHIQFATKLIYI